jgi:thiosulfate reductase cytochrome b subunit
MSEGEPAVVEIREPVAAAAIEPAYEHPWAVRACHWANAVALTVLAMSGLQIFFAFPSFGSKIPEHDLVQRIPAAIRLGGWLGGALQWHFTFMWIFAGTALLYAGYQVLSGHLRTVLFAPSDAAGVWPMVRHYFLFGPKPPPTGQYNALQKLAYTSTLAFGAVSLATGAVMYKPVQLSAVGWLFGGYHTARLLHFLAMCGFLAFIPGHLIMVALHGWDNFQSMLTGWKRHPDYPARGPR